MKAKNFKRLFYILTLYFLQINYAESQRLLLHFNNATDKQAMEQEVSNLITIDNFITVSSETQNPDTEIQIIFYDPGISGILELTEVTVDIESFVTKWKESHIDKSRLLMLFIKSDSKYSIEKLVGTALLEEGQLPKIISDYIELKIMKSQDSYGNSIKAGYNAILNAFNQRFTNSLIEIGNQMLLQKKYYKGYCYPPKLPYDKSYEAHHYDEQIYYRFRLTEQNTIWDEELPVEYLRATANSASYMGDYYFNGPFDRMRTSNHDKINTLLFGFTNKLIFGAGSKHIRLNRKTGTTTFEPLSSDEIFYYDGIGTKRYFNDPSVNSEYLEIYDEDNFRNIELVSIKHEFDANSPNAFNTVNNTIEQILQSAEHFNTGHNRYSFCKEKIIIDRVREGERLPLRVLDLYYGGSEPTWCNTYAMDLLNDIYELEVLPWKGANALNDLFQNDEGNNFLPILSNDDIAFNDLINAGYPVIFSYKNLGQGSGHIEIGFPNTDFLTTIGAGSSTGIKIFPDESFGTTIAKTAIKRYLYLGYLTFEYEQ